MRPERPRVGRPLTQRHHVTNYTGSAESTAGGLMDSSSTSDGGASSARFAKELRTISVSTAAALAQVAGASRTALVLARADDLLNDLEDKVRRDGNDSSVLAAIEAARTDLRG